MNKIIKEKHYLVISLLSAVSVYLLSIAFQIMAYWGNGLFFYWIGAALTYLVWLAGTSFLIMAIRNNKMNFIYAIGYVVSGLLLTIGFMWVTFIISMGSAL
ncbi:hypothetical protein GCM10008932_09890 [Alkalibacterium iburiense]|uniref:DUF3902 family protein n=1 Tax=Alkalibacterium iburiense TaxID=290589 RepID=A0ABP3H0E7_9LACT